MGRRRKNNNIAPERSGREVALSSLNRARRDLALAIAAFWGADSLDTVELVMALEEEFECEIPDEEAEKITTVQLAIDYAVKHQKA